MKLSMRSASLKKKRWRFRDTWEAFREEVGAHSRFFSPFAQEMLDSIFGDLTDLQSYDGRPVVRTIGPGHSGRFVWRARKALSQDELETILKVSRPRARPSTIRPCRGRQDEC